jgi:hypothetical protein
MLAMTPTTFVPRDPDTGALFLYLRNYEAVFTNQSFLRAIGNSLIVAASTTLLSVGDRLDSPAFALGKLRYRGKTATLYIYSGHDDVSGHRRVDRAVCDHHRAQEQHELNEGQVNYCCCWSGVGAGVLGILAEQDLAPDVNGGGPETPELLSRLAQACLPQLRIVLNHLGNPAITREPPPASWVSGIRAAATCSNVFCKVSALVEGAAREQYVTERKRYSHYDCSQESSESSAADAVVTG